MHQQRILQKTGSILDSEDVNGIAWYIVYMMVNPLKLIKVVFINFKVDK